MEYDYKWNKLETCGMI